jgi:hypothetical protein
MSEREYMPILHTPLRLVMRTLNEEWAQKNHNQSLERLADRGGLGLSEAAAIIERRKWRSMTDAEALEVIKRARWN